MILLVGYLLLALVFSFLCSLLEAVLLSVPRSHVAVLVERGSVAGARLQRMKDDVDRPLAAILTLNTFAHTLGAAGVGAEAAILWGDAWVGLVSLVVTLLILVLSEIIPKTLGAVHAKGLAPFAAWVIQWLIVILRPVVAVCNWVSTRMAGESLKVPAISRDEVRSLANIALTDGAIDETEFAIIRNLIALRETTVGAIMTPRTVVFALRAEQTVREVTQGGLLRFARIPIIESSLDNPKGLIHRHQLLKAMGEGKADARLGDLVRPLHTVPEMARIPAVLAEFLKRREQLFLVVDEHGGSAGIVTLEDVLETLLGVEIVDETDAVEDMRRLAKQLLARRRKQGEGDAG